MAQMRSQIAAEERRSADQMAQSLAHSVELDLAVDNTAELQTTARSMVTQDEVEFVAIYDSKNKLVASGVTGMKTRGVGIPRGHRSRAYHGRR